MFWARLAVTTLLFLCGQCAAGETVIALQARAGQTAWLNSTTTLYGDYHILWYLNSETIVLFEKGALQRDPPTRYQGRLDVDHVTGSVRISNLRVEDSGVYTGEITSGDNFVHKVHCNVTVLKGDPIVTTAGPHHGAAQTSHVAAGVCGGIFICALVGLFFKAICPLRVWRKEPGPQRSMV